MNGFDLASVALGFIIGVIIVSLYFRKKTVRLKTLIKKYYYRWFYCNLWLYQRDAHVSVYDALRDRGIKKIAIYGMGDSCQHLMAEIEGTDIEIAYLIDAYSENKNEEYPFYPSSSNDFPPVDAVVITPFRSYERVSSSLRDRLSAEFIDIKDII